MSTVRLPYDDTSLEVSIPKSVRAEALLPKPMNPIGDPRAELLRSIANPVGGRTLEALARESSGTVLIVCSDQTRADGRQEVLPWILDELNRCGVSDSKIMIIVAYGSHIKPDPKRIPELVGPASSRVRVFEHDASGAMLDRGVTRAGTPVRVNPILGEAGLVITYSSVVHHYFAGYGGGRKLIVPGLASLDTISANHSLIWENPRGTGGRHPMARSGILDGNPVNEDLMDALRLALGDTPEFSIATVFNSGREFGFFAAGDIDRAHRAAARFADEHFMVHIDGPADVVLASAGGRPKDINIIQAHKGLDNAVRALKPGGTLLFVMACPDGLGSPVVKDFAPLSLDEIRARLAGVYEVYGQTTHAIKTKTRDHRVVSVSSLDPIILSTLGFIPAKDINEAMSLIAGDLLSARRVFILPRADVTLPRLTP